MRQHKAETVSNDRHCKGGNLQSDDGKPKSYKDSNNESEVMRYDNEKNTSKGDSQNYIN